MKLFLASHVIDPQCFPEFEKFIGGKLADKSVIFIPTARNGEGVTHDWKLSPTLKLLQTTCSQLSILELEDVKERDVLPDFKGKQIIFFGGGYSGYLLYWIRRARLDKALPDLLNKGAIYVGSSAGAMACSKTQYSAEIFDDAEYGASLMPGLGYVDFEIRPHYTDDMYDETVKRWKSVGKGELCLLKDGEAIKVSNGEVQFFGEKRMIN